MPARLRRDRPQWGMPLGLYLGILFGAIATLGYWISPTDYARYIPLSPSVLLAVFVGAGLVFGVGVVLLGSSSQTRNSAALLGFAAAVPFSTVALIASHGVAYLRTGSHWVIVLLLALGGPVLATLCWRDDR